MDVRLSGFALSSSAIRTLFPCVRACVRVCGEQNHLAIYGKQWPYDVTPREDKTLPCGKLNAPVSSALTIVS